MYVPQDSMWWEIWKILQNILETKQDLCIDYAYDCYPRGDRTCFIWTDCNNKIIEKYFLHFKF